MKDSEGYRRRSRKKEEQLPWPFLDWEDHLWDFKGRGDPSFFFHGFAEESSTTDSTMTSSSSRGKAQSFLYPPDYDFKRITSKKSNGYTATAREERLKRRSPGVIAKLMGLDMLPAHKPTFVEYSSPSEEFKDVYEVTDFRKTPARNKSPSRLRQFESFQDPFLKLDHKPRSQFIKHLEERLRSSDARPIVILKSSDLEESCSLQWRSEWNPKPTHDQIVVLEPGLGDFPVSRGRDSRERKLASAKSSRGIAREITEQMVRHDTKEARKRLLERWKTAQRLAEGRAQKRHSGTTLAEVLASAKREASRSSVLERGGERPVLSEYPCMGTLKTMKPKKKKLPRVEGISATEGFEPFVARKKVGKGAACGVEVDEHLSPVSVLDHPDESTSSLENIYGTKVDQGIKHGRITEAEEIQQTFKDEDNLEFCYLLDILIDSGLYKVDRDALLRVGFAPGLPVDPGVYHNLESIYSHLPWPGMDRKLMFDQVNCILARISESLTCVRTVSAVNGLLVREVWESLVERSTVYDASLLTPRDIADMTWGGNSADMKNEFGAEIESVISDDLFQEIFAEFCSF